MAYREVYLVQVLEVIRRWQLGESRRAIARATGLSRNTVEKYVRAAVAAGVSQGGSPPEEEVLTGLLRRNQPGPSLSSSEAPLFSLLKGQQERIEAWLSKEQLQLTRVHELLLGQGVLVSYTTLRRFVRRAGLGKAPRSTLRMAEWRWRRWTSAASACWWTRRASAGPSGRWWSYCPTAATASSGRS